MYFSSGIKFPRVDWLPAWEFDTPYVWLSSTNTATKPASSSFMRFFSASCFFGLIASVKYVSQPLDGSPAAKPSISHRKYRTYSSVHFHTSSNCSSISVRSHHIRAPLYSIFFIRPQIRYPIKLRKKYFHLTTNGTHYDDRARICGAQPRSPHFR
jgi:hypothetical protein